MALMEHLDHLCHQRAAVPDADVVTAAIVAALLRWSPSPISRWHKPPGSSRSIPQPFAARLTEVVCQPTALARGGLVSILSNLGERAEIGSVRPRLIRAVMVRDASTESVTEMAGDASEKVLPISL